MLFTQQVTVTWSDGRTTEVGLDQRDLIAAADNGSPMPSNTDDTVGLMRYLRAATRAHMLRDKTLAPDAEFDDLVVEVAPDVEEQEVDPTEPAS